MKIYQQEWWLRKKYLRERMNIVEMAKEAGCSAQTIQRYLQKYNLIRNPRSWKGGR